MARDHVDSRFRRLSGPFVICSHPLSTCSHLSFKHRTVFYNYTNRASPDKFIFLIIICKFLFILFSCFLNFSNQRRFNTCYKDQPDETIFQPFCLYTLLIFSTLSSCKRVYEWSLWVLTFIILIVRYSLERIADFVLLKPINQGMTNFCTINSKLKSANEQKDVRTNNPTKQFATKRTIVFWFNCKSLHQNKRLDKRARDQNRAIILIWCFRAT